MYGHKININVFLHLKKYSKGIFTVFKHDNTLVMQWAKGTEDTNGRAMQTI